MKHSKVLIVLILSAFLILACSTVEPAKEIPAQENHQAESGVVSTVNVLQNTSNPEPIETPSGISSDELKVHNTKPDCWVAYKGKVYDLTSWIPNHPGGPQIAAYCGTSSEFTAAFNGQHGTKKEGKLEMVGDYIGEFSG